MAESSTMSRIPKSGRSFGNGLQAEVIVGTQASINEEPAG